MAPRLPENTLIRFAVIFLAGYLLILALSFLFDIALIVFFIWAVAAAIFAGLANWTHVYAMTFIATVIHISPFLLLVVSRPEANGDGIELFFLRKLFFTSVGYAIVLTLALYLQVLILKPRAQKND